MENKMYIAYRTELDLTNEQKKLANQHIGNCRVVANAYKKEKDKAIKEGKNFSPYDFDKEFKKKLLDEKPYLAVTLNLSRKQSTFDMEKGYKRFLKGLGGYPKFKKYSDNIQSYYFCRNGINHVLQVERHKIKIPGLRWCKLKEKGYIPIDNPIISGRVIREAGRYYVSVIVEEDNIKPIINTNWVQGIDLGIKETSICSNGVVIPNINKEWKIKRLEKQIKHIQRKLSRQLEARKERCQSENIKAKDLPNKNIEKTKRRIQRLYQRLRNIRKNFQNKAAIKILKDNPKAIVLEKLNIKGMMKNRHLAKAVRDQALSTFKNTIIRHAYQKGIEVREVSMFYPSSKICSKCGNIKKDLKLSERTYKCDKCSNTIDRDLNAAINLANAKDYKVIDILGKKSKNDTKNKNNKKEVSYIAI